MLNNFYEYNESLILLGLFLDFLADSWNASFIVLQSIKELSNIFLQFLSTPKVYSIRLIILSGISEYAFNILNEWFLIQIVVIL